MTAIELTEAEQRDLRIQDMLKKALLQLRKTERGTQALKDLSAFLQNGGAGLDMRNQDAVRAILKVTFACPWNLPGGYNLVGGYSDLVPPVEVDR